MPPALQVSLEDVLLAINDIKKEIASLAAGLGSAEERIARLENTPRSSPSTEISPACAGSKSIPEIDKHVLPNLGSELPEGQNPVIARLPNSGPSKSFEGRSCKERSCDIERHLLPINIGINTLTEHVLRIERALQTNKPAAVTKMSPISTASTGKGPISVTPKRHHLPQQPSPKQTDGTGSRRHTSENFLVSPQPIFGQTSTPSRAYHPLNISASPFSNYVNDESPFSQLAIITPNRRAFGKYRVNNTGS